MLPFADLSEKAAMQRKRSIALSLPSRSSDYSVRTAWRIQGSSRYLLDETRSKMDFPSLKKAVVEQIQKHRSQLVLIEDKASGTRLTQELRG